MSRAQFIPESRRNGDRYARTLQEAFGPYAELHVEPEELPGTRLIPWALFFALCFGYAAIFWHKLG